MKVFRFQFDGNETYRRYCQLLNKRPENVKSIGSIPFLPIEFFKTHEIKTGEFKAEKVFESSGTTGTVSSKHHVKDLKLYEESFLRCVRLFFKPLKDYVIMALLPAYLERGNSSLIYMVETLINRSGRNESGFFLYDHNALYEQLTVLEKRNEKVLLIGVSFALLDFAGKFSMELNSTMIMETGGMKGRREEITREELHEDLMTAFGVEKIYSEYGMTELLSQAYSTGGGKFQTPPWMKMLPRDVNDPIGIMTSESKDDEAVIRTGAVNVIDLANLDSCSFIATQDLMKLHADGSFEILGRIDNSDVRGCNLLLE